MEHELKTWPLPFAAILSGEKKHEIRVADRPFAVGDRLILREWKSDAKTYTGRVFHARCTYITKGGEWGLPDGMCVMSIEPVDDQVDDARSKSEVELRLSASEIVAMIDGDPHASPEGWAGQAELYRSLAVVGMVGEEKAQEMLIGQATD